MFDILRFLRDTTERVIKMNFIFKRNAARNIISLFLCLFAGFLIFDQNGYLAIKNTDDGTVYRTEFQTSLLPSADRALLRRGIWCETPSDAARVLENFDS